MALARSWFDLPAWSVPLAVACLVVKDLILFPFVRHAYSSEGSRLVGTGRLVGARAVVAERIDPEGWVKVGGELWQAVSERAGVAIEVGAEVRVRDVEGLRLQVVQEDS